MGYGETGCWLPLAIKSCPRTCFGRLDDFPTTASCLARLLHPSLRLVLDAAVTTAARQSFLQLARYRMDSMSIAFFILVGVILFALFINVR